MIVGILAFGIAKDIVGERAIQLDVGSAATVADLKALLKSKYPALDDLPNFMIAINSRYAEDIAQLQPNDEIAIIPPTNGG